MSLYCTITVWVHRQTFSIAHFKQCNVASVCINCVQIVQACEFSRGLKLMYRTTGHMRMQKEYIIKLSIKGSTESLRCVSKHMDAYFLISVPYFV